MNIENFKSCPHCNGSLGFYLKVREKFSYHDRTSWDGKKLNDDKYDHGVITWSSKQYRCLECNKIICKKND